MFYKKLKLENKISDVIISHTNRIISDKIITIQELKKINSQLNKDINYIPLYLVDKKQKKIVLGYGFELTTNHYLYNETKRLFFKEFGSKDEKWIINNAGLTFSSVFKTHKKAKKELNDYLEINKLIK